MKLYYAKGACSLAVRIIINEIGLPCEYESVDLRAKKTETGADFLTINPKGAVPTLQIDEGEILTENGVILQYLSDKANATQLLAPIGDFKRYRELEWLNFVATELHKSFGPLFNPAFPQEVKEKIIIPLIKSKFNYVDKHLQNKKYLLGENFTLPDAYLFVMESWTFHFNIDLAEWTNILRHFNELRKRKPIQQSLEAEGLQKMLA